MLFEVHVCAWLPYTTMRNVSWDLPEEKRIGAGPHFLGDHLHTPPLSPEGMRGKRVRAWQYLKLPAHSWGSSLTLGQPDVVAGDMVILGEDGQRMQTAPGRATRSSARVGFIEALDAYEIDLAGEATIPFLVEAAVALARCRGEHLPGMTDVPEPGASPALGWQLHVLIQKGTGPIPVRAGMDESGQFFSGCTSLGGAAEGLVHGTIATRAFPSYVVYVTLTRPEGSRYSAPVFFANGFGRKISGIRAWQTSSLRPVTW
ncbi:MAG TPA: hypothetical protein VKI17_02580 [Gemmataceae bacterium]|nr:hypothetical protein [Gemmataceae bacterium]